MESVVWGGTVVAAVVAGAIALFAPCCISVMLPAYFAGTFPNRGRLAAMTFLFAAGVATLILPIAMGGAFLRQLIVAEHTAIYAAAGLLMLGMAGYLLLGGQLHLPGPGRRAGGAAGPWSVYSLGVFSGVATTCCAPVLASVIALSSIASSFAAALGLGLAYVLGMVAPLFAIALLWDRHDWRASRFFRPSFVSWRVGSVRRTISVVNLASGLLLAAVGGWMTWAAFFTDGMTPSRGWQLRLSAQLQHVGRMTTDALAWVPGWAIALLLIALVVLAARQAFSQMDWSDDPRNEEEAVAWRSRT